MASDPQSILRDPERNIQIGCWYLEKMYEQFQDEPEAETRMVAAYNAGQAARSNGAGPTSRATRNRERSLSTASTFPRPKPTCFRSCNVTGSSRVELRAPRCSRLRLSNDDHLHGALGTSRRPTDRTRGCRGGGTDRRSRSRAEIVERFPESKLESFGDAVILPGLINTHTHLELTALRGYLENEERDFFAWLRKLTLRGWNY